MDFFFGLVVQKMGLIDVRNLTQNTGFGAGERLLRR
jgi:hypothetical protein